MTKSRHIPLFIGVALLGLSSCATGPEKPVVDSASVSRYMSIAPEEAIQTLENLYETGKQNELAFYSPNYFKLAGKDLDEAKSLHKKKADASLIANKLASVESSLNAASKVKEVAVGVLKPALQLRDDLKQIDADNSFKGDFKDVVSGIDDIIKTVEKGDIKKADKDLATLMAGMKKFQAKVIKYNALHVAEETIEKAINANATKLAPKTIKIAQETLKSSENVIQQNVLDADVVKKAGDSALFAAKHALAIAEQAAKLPERTKNAEDYLLEIEIQIRDVGEALDAPDVRDRTIGYQTAALAEFAKEKIAHNTQKAASSKKADELAESVKKLEQTNKQLTNQLGDRDKEIAQLKSQLEKMEASTGSNLTANATKTENNPSAP